MDRQDRNIEDLFRTLFEPFTVNPSPGLWQKIQGKIAWKQFLSFNLNSLNIYYLALIIAVAGAGSAFIFSRTLAPRTMQIHASASPGQATLEEPSSIPEMIRKDPVKATGQEPELKQAEREKAKAKDNYLLPSPSFLRKEFRVEKPVKRATLYASALGNYEMHINGQRVGNDYFTPGWTDYNKRVYYNTYDVTDMINAGANAIGGILAEGSCMVRLP